MTWPKGHCGRTKKNLFPTSTAYQCHRSWRQHDESLPANNPAPDASYTTLDALESKNATSSIHFFREILNSLTESYEEKNLSDADLWGKSTIQQLN